MITASDATKIPNAQLNAIPLSQPCFKTTTIYLGNYYAKLLVPTPSQSCKASNARQYSPSLLFFLLLPEHPNVSNMLQLACHAMHAFC